jgi:UDP-N-acetylglucosamine--N-acetylmuramyl-(pentapeptide) pyrophosphoryl-undecaprenol N-acetylglucosamine transferase
VPYPWHKDRQQLFNAREAAAAGAAEIVEEGELDAPAVRRIVRGILLDAERRERMAAAAASVARPDAARAMAAHIVESFGPALGQPSWSGELGG